MNSEILAPYLTPYKLGRPVLAGSGISAAFDEKAVDCSFVFQHNDVFYMTFVGFDGKGYQTGLARSRDLLNWEKLGVILKRGEGHAWDRLNAAGTWLLCENDLDRPRTLVKWQGRYWMAYHTYPGEGYEVGPGRIGLAWCDDEHLLTWHRLPDPILIPEDGGDWERGGLYKESLILHEGVFYLFYNAKDQAERWTEQTGLATSTDLRTWVRYSGSPVLRASEGRWDAGFCSDPCVVRHTGRWAMYYFGYDYRHAQEGIAFSDDLYRWEKHSEPIITVGAAGEIDSIHAHKPALITYAGTRYHFYTACRPTQPGDPTINAGNEFRCITVATSRPIGSRAVIN